MLALISYFPQDAKGIGSIQLPKDAREKLARESKRWCCKTCGSDNASALPELSKEQQAAAHSQQQEKQPIEQVLDAGAVNSLEVQTPQTAAVNAVTIFANNATADATTDIDAPIVEQDNEKQSPVTAPAPEPVQKPAEVAAVAPPPQQQKPTVAARATNNNTRIAQQRSHDQLLAKFNGAITVILLIISALLVNKYIIREPAL